MAGKGMSQAQTLWNVNVLLLIMCKHSSKWRYIMWRNTWSLQLCQDVSQPDFCDVQSERGLLFSLYPLLYIRSPLFSAESQRWISLYLDRKLRWESTLLCRRATYYITSLWIRDNSVKMFLLPVLFIQTDCLFSWMSWNEMFVSDTQSTNSNVIFTASAFVLLFSLY